MNAVGDSSEAPVRSYLPGDWFGIVGERAVVILPPTKKPRNTLYAAAPATAFQDTCT